ncbi:MAG: flagellar hook basal-body protein [Saprospiraceae bacterium]|nr:flagellar hook basal-body protein [Saprospiraceae bacterium]
MIGALWTGISGLSSQQQALDNESNNIANVNTIGFKSSRISFADQMYQDRIGKGSKILDAEKLYTQGNLKLTGVNYDMALSGDGFFTVVNQNSSGTSESFYTRAGNFRMGDNGTLQDAAGNEVQGWMMTAIDSQNDVTSTNPNVSVFTDDYTKLLSSKIVRHGTYVETITAKATDYSSSAKSDSTSAFSGDGAKTKSSKMSDIEAAVADYTSWLQKLKDEPDASSATSIAQTSQINFKSGTDSIISKDGDQIYTYINGNKYSQNFLLTSASSTFKQDLWNTSSVAQRTAEGLIDPSTLGAIVSPAIVNGSGLDQTQLDAANAAYDKAASKIETYKALADKISQIPGLVATMAIDSGKVDAFNSSESYVSSTKNADMLKGIIQIKSLIPGTEFTVSEVAEVSGNAVVQGNYQSTTLGAKGSGIGALETSRNALSQLITGKQQDVYTAADLKLSKSPMFQYNLTIYDKELGVNIPVPNDGAFPPQSVPLFIDATDSNGGFTIDELVNKFNQAGSSSNPALSSYVVARNVNNNLVIETLDSNFDVEFTGNMKQLPTMQINLNEIIDNANYTFNIQNGADLVNLSLSDTTYNPFILATSLNNTLSQSQVYNTLRDKIANYNSTNPIDKLYITPLNNGNFNIYTQNENINFMSSSIGLVDDIPDVNSIAGVSGIVTTLDATKISVSFSS